MILSTCLAELSLQGSSLQWSQDLFADKFNESYKLITGGGRSVVGASEVCRSRFFGRRWLHWEAAGGVICLREIWLDNDLVDHALCLKFGDIYLGAPLAVHFETLPSSGSAIEIRACFVMCDGSLHHINFSSQQEDRSVLADLVDYQAGGLLCTRTERFSFKNSAGLIRSHQISDSMRDNQTICCASHLSHFGIIFGLSQGDIVYIRMSPDRLFVETLLRDEGALSALWSGIVGPAKRPAVLATSGSHLRDLSILVAVSADGVLRVWDCLSRYCLKQFPMLSLLQDDIGEQDAIMEGVCVDTNPVLSDGAGLLIAVGVTVRVGQMRTWSVVILSWDPIAPSKVPVRAYLTPPSYDKSSLDSTEVSLEQITISPCCSHKTDEITVVSLWNVNGEIVPVQYVLSGLDISSRAHRTADPADDVPVFEPTITAFGPAETHQSLSTADEYLIRRAQLSVGWTPLGQEMTGSFDNRSKFMKMTFLQRLFYPGRFSPDIIVGMLSHDVPYELQENYASLSTYITDNSYATTDILMEKVLTVCDAMEEILVQEMQISGSVDTLPTLQLRAQAETSLRVLSLCEARKKAIRSSSGSCSVLTRSRGLYDDSADAPAESTVPFEFVVVRPSGLGVVVWARCMGDAHVDHITDYARLPSSRLNFRSANVSVGSEETRARAVAIQILAATAQGMDGIDLHSFDASVTRFVCDVVSVTESNSGWVIDSLKSIILDSDASDVLNRIADVWTVHTSHASDDDLFDILSGMMNGIGGDMASLMPSPGDTNGANRRGPLRGIVGSKLLQEACSLALRDHYDYAKTVSCALIAIVNTKRIHLSAEARNIIITEYLPQSRCYMLHTALILWMQSVQVSNNRQLERTIDFVDVQFDSNIINSLRGMSNSSGGISVTRFHSESSLWTSFWLKQCHNMDYRDGEDWESIIMQCMSAVRPSCQSEFISFLYSRGQYACIVRASAIGIYLDSLPGVRPPVTDGGDIFADNLIKLSGYFTVCHNKTLHAISFLQSHLRDICNVCYDMSEKSYDERLQQELQRCVESILHLPAPPELQSSPLISFSGDYLEDNGMDDGLEDRDNMHESIVESMKQYILTCSGYFELEQTLCFGEAMIKLSHQGCFRVLYRKLQLEMNTTGIHPIVALVQQCPDMLVMLYTLYHNSNAQRLLDRARAVLPSLCGDSLALRGCYCTIDSIQNIKTTLFSEFGDWIMSPPLVNELDIEWAAVWSSVFKFALHSVLLDESLAAVLELIKLSKLSDVSMYLDSISSNTHHSTDDRWKSCLRALITKACATGHLGWLCALPETMGGEDGDGAVIDLTAEIATQMEFLASSSDFADIANLSSHALEEDVPDALSMYEYLATFFTSKRDFSQCARVMYQFYGRLEVEGPATLGRISVQARSLSIAVSALHNVSENQQFIVYRTHHLDPSSSSDSFIQSALGKRSIDGVMGAALAVSESRGRLSYITLPELEHALLQLQCKISIAEVLLAESDSGYRQSEDKVNESIFYSADDMDIARMLCAQDNFFDALNLAMHNFPTNSSNAQNIVLEFVVDSLAAKCAQNPKGSSSILEQFIAVHGCATRPVDHLSHQGPAASPDMWEYLVSCLHIIDGPSKNWALHRIATQASLRVAPSAQVPPILTSSHCGRDAFHKDRDTLLAAKKVSVASHVAVPSKCIGNFPDLLRTLVKEGALVEACRLATLFLTECDPRHRRMEAIPLEALDQLLNASSDALAMAEEDGVDMATDSGHYGKLNHGYNGLKDAVKMYFSKLCLAEIGE